MGHDCGPIIHDTPGCWHVHSLDRCCCELGSISGNVFGWSVGGRHIADSNQVRGRCVSFLILWKRHRLSGWRCTCSLLSCYVYVQFCLGHARSRCAGSAGQLASLNQLSPTYARSPALCWQACLVANVWNILYSGQYKRPPSQRPVPSPID